MSSNDENRVNELKQKMNSMISNLDKFLKVIGKQTPRSKLLNEISTQLFIMNNNLGDGTLTMYENLAQKYLEGEKKLVEDYNNNAISDNDFIKKYEKYPNSETGKTPPSKTEKNPPSEIGVVDVIDNIIKQIINDIDAAISTLESLLDGSQKESSRSESVKIIISELKIYKDSMLELQLKKKEIETNESENRIFKQNTKTINDYLNGIEQLVDDYNNIEDHDFTEKYKKYPVITTGKTNHIDVNQIDVIDDKDEIAKKIAIEIKNKYRDINQLIFNFKKKKPKYGKEIELERQKNSNFTNSLIAEIKGGKYNDKLDEPKKIFDEHIKNVKHELFIITGENYDDNNPPPPPQLAPKFQQIDVINPDVTNTSGSGGGSGSGSGGGSGTPPKPPLKPLKPNDANAFTQALLEFDENNVSNKATSIQQLLENKLNLSLKPEIKDHSVTIVSIFKDGNNIRYDAFNVDNIEADSYVPATFTYPSRMVGGNTHFKTIRNKHNNHHKTRKSAKKHLSKRKKVKLNKNRKTHHK